MNKILAFCSILVAFVASTVGGERIRNLEGHAIEMRPLTGHLMDRPFANLYRSYAEAFIRSKDPTLAADDHRSWAPSADECINFLRVYKTSDRNIENIEDLVILDACLGYLYHEQSQEFHEVDKERSKLAENDLDSMIADEDLKMMYSGTQIATLPEPAKECVANLLISSIMMRKQFPEVRCNNNWIQLFLQFADCHKEIPQNLRGADSYIDVVYKNIREETHRCFDLEIRTLNEAVRSDFERSYASRAGIAVGSLFSSRLKQQSERMWTSTMTNLMGIIQGTKRAVNLREVHNILRGFYKDDPVFTRRLLTNMGLYADSKVKPKSKDLKTKDPTGRMRYRQVVDDLCNPFRSSDRSSVDYSKSLVRLVQLLEHPDVFDLSFGVFMRNILERARETSPLYLCVSACNVLSFTEGEIQIPHHNGHPSYKVTMMRDLTNLVRWPDAGYY